MGGWGGLQCGREWRRLEERGIKGTHGDGEEYMALKRGRKGERGMKEWNPTSKCRSCGLYAVGVGNRT